MSGNGFRHELTAAVLVQRVVGIVRTADAASADAAARTLLAAGLHAVELTLTIPDVLGLLRPLAADFPHAVIGAGTVLDEPSATAVIRAGARFVVSPNLNPDVIRACHRHGVPALPGVGSVSEVVRALEAGADAIKVFPASAITPRWISDVRAALPQAVLVPTGGVAPEDVPDWLAAGAAACGVGSALTKGSAEEAAGRIRTLLDRLSSTGTAPVR